MDSETHANESPPLETTGTDGSHGGGAGDDRWLDRPGSVDTIVRLLIVACVASVVADFFYVKHGHWHFQDLFGFDAAYGFVACVGLVLAAKGLRVLLMRSEDYYD